MSLGAVVLVAGVGRQYQKDVGRAVCLVGGEPEGCFTWKPSEEQASQGRA